MFDFFKREKNPEKILENVQAISSKLIIKGYRKFGSTHNCAPTSKITDQQIIKIYSEVGTAFHEAAEKRGEHIPALFKNTIVLYFLSLYEASGEQFLQEHLKYEVNKYLREGLRPDYQRDLELFNPDSDDREVRQLRKLQGEVRQKLESELRTKEKKSPALPYSKFADIVLRWSIAAAGDSLEIAQKASLVKMNEVTQEALTREIVAYHLNVTLSDIMAKKALFGKENYDQIETGICDAIRCILEEEEKDSPYLPLIDSENRAKARMYFLKDARGLEISEEQMHAFAKKHEKQKVLAEMPKDQMAFFFYTVRIARLLEVGTEIDKVIVWGVNNKLIDRVLKLQAEVLESVP